MRIAIKILIVSRFDFNKIQVNVTNKWEENNVRVYVGEFFSYKFARSSRRMRVKYAPRKNGFRQMLEKSGFPAQKWVGKLCKSRVKICVWVVR